MSLSKDPKYIASEPRPKKKRAYQPPVLVLHGDLRKVTMGVSAGVIGERVFGRILCRPLSGLFDL